MARVDRIQAKQVNREFVLDFCETGMDCYTKKLFKAFFESDWNAIKSISMDYERDCYTVGAIEIVGKLIKLRLLLQDEPVCVSIIERTLTSILEQSARVQEFLIKHLQNADPSLMLNNVNFISLPENSSVKIRQEWFYSNCSVQ